MMAPDETFVDYMLDLEDLDHVAHNAQREHEMRQAMLKSGWCMTNHHHICPAQFVTADDCTCPCHSEEPKLTELEGWDLI